jgi:drug/metabolite transporter (DMT)-like permease
MKLYIFAISLAVMSNIFYHIFQKSIPGGANPILSLTVTYAVALIGSIILLPIYQIKAEGVRLSEFNLLLEFSRLNWTSFVLGVAIIGLELGFLLAYRAGWNISLASLFSNTVVSLLLIPAGLLFFQEKLNIYHAAGIVLCVAGLILVNQK